MVSDLAFCFLLLSFSKFNVIDIEWNLRLNLTQILLDLTFTYLRCFFLIFNASFEEEKNWDLQLIVECWNRSRSWEPTQISTILSTKVVQSRVQRFICKITRNSSLNKNLNESKCIKHHLKFLCKGTLLSSVIR